jgi:hypothetical protein
MHKVNFDAMVRSPVISEVFSTPVVASSTVSTIGRAASGCRLN